MGENKQKKEVKKPKTKNKGKTENLPPHLKRATTAPSGGVPPKGR